jgi:hypothetical protein
VGGVAAEQVLAGAAMRVGGGQGDHGIAEHCDIGPRAHGVDLVVGRPCGPLVEERGGHRGQVPARREADDADPPGVNLVTCRVGPNEAQRPLHVDELHGVVVALAAEPVMQDEGRRSDPVGPAGDLGALVVGCEGAVAASRADHEGGPAGSIVCGGVDLEEGLIGRGRARGERGTVRPERHHLWLRSRRQPERAQGEHQRARCHSETKHV